MKNSAGITFVVLLSLIYCAEMALATKVCLLRTAESAKCSARGVHLDASETTNLKVFCDQAGHVLTTRGGQVSEQAFDCAQLNASSFVWLSWNDYLGQVKTAVDNDKNYLEGNVYLGRNILQRDENPFEFCRLEMSTGHCVAIGGSQDVLSTEVLVQRLPLRYDLKTVQRGSWKNVTEGETIVLAKTHLINRDENTQFVQKVIPFDLAREVQFELPDHLVQDIAVNVYDEAGRLGLRFDVGDAATTLISKSVPAIKRLLGRTILEVTVKGRTERVLSMLTGDLITVFDRNDDKAVAERFTKNLVLNRIDVGVQDVQVEYGVFAKLDTPIKDDDFPSKEEESQASPDAIEEEVKDNSVALFQSNAVYPSLQPYYTVAYMVFCTTIVVTMFDVVRQLRNNRKLKKGGSYSTVATAEVHY